MTYDTDKTWMGEAESALACVRALSDEMASYAWDLLRVLGDVPARKHLYDWAVQIGQLQEGVGKALDRKLDEDVALARRGWDLVEYLGHNPEVARRIQQQAAAEAKAAQEGKEDE